MSLHVFILQQLQYRVFNGAVVIFTHDILFSLKQARNQPVITNSSDIDEHSSASDPSKGLLRVLRQTRND